MWTDAHCHLTDARIFPEAEKILAECREEGVGRFLLGGISPEEWARQIQLKKAHPKSIGLCFGLHPWWVDERAGEADQCDADDKVEEALTQLRRDAPNLTAIGETGLDFARGRRDRSESSQRWAFREQLLIAQQAAKPVVLHVVQAHEEALKILDEQQVEQKKKFRGLVHSFSGSWEQAQRYIHQGFLISVGARSTYPDANALHRVIEQCPGENLVFETDAPDQPPFGHRGEMHTPVSLLKVAEKCAQIRGQTAVALLEQSEHNLSGVFSWN